jgi:hypothetical protein
VRVAGITNAVNPTITTERPHGLSIGHKVLITDWKDAPLRGAYGALGTWTVLAVPTALTFTVTMATAPGVYESGGGTGSLMDLTGYSGRMKVRDAAGSELLSITPTLGGTDGTVAIALTAAQTATLVWRFGRYQIEVYTAADADVVRVADGRITVSPELVV